MPPPRGHLISDGVRTFRHLGLDGAGYPLALRRPPGPELIPWISSSTSKNLSVFCAEPATTSAENAQGTGTAGTTGVVTPYTYGPYGEPASWAGSRFRYVGRVALPEAQLYHYKARAYDPATGRFLQTDPIGYGDGMNVYAYVRGDPVNLEDTSGLDPYDLYDSEARAANAAILDTHSLLMSTGLEPISRIFRTNDGQFTYVPFVVGTVNRSSTENLAGAVSIFLNTGHFATQVSSIHGHPGSSPPSRDDLKHDANAHMTGIVVSMNGRVDVHKPPNENNRFDSTGIMANVNDANTVEELVVTANRNVEAQIGAGQSGGGFWQGLGNALGNLGSAISSGFRGILEWLTKLF